MWSKKKKAHPIYGIIIVYCIYEENSSFRKFIYVRCQRSRVLYVLWPLVDIKQTREIVKRLPPSCYPETSCKVQYDFFLSAGCFGRQYYTRIHLFTPGSICCEDFYICHIKRSIYEYKPPPPTTTPLVSKERQANSYYFINLFIDVLTPKLQKVISPAPGHHPR